MARLDGKVAFVTGAARGQGRSHAVRLASEGAAVIASDLCRQIESVPYPLATRGDLDETVALVEGVGGKILAVEADVRELSQLAAALDAGLEAFGHVDIAVANAGIMPMDPADRDPERAWQDAIDVLLSGVWKTLRVVAPPMVERGAGGSIVLTSSTAGLKGTTDGTGGTMGYCAAKHGVVGLMRAYANLLAPHSIRVNSVHPTGVNSPMVVNDAMDAWFAANPDVASQMVNAMPVQLIEPGDVSAAVAWLASDDARYVTGVTLPVDAGYLVR